MNPKMSETKSPNKTPNTTIAQYAIVSKIGEGGMGPAWRADGKELYYYTPDGALMAVDMGGGSNLAIGVPHKLFEFRSGNGLITVAPFDVSGDGKRFLLNTLVDESGGAPLTISSGASTFQYLD